MRNQLVTDIPDHQLVRNLFDLVDEKLLPMIIYTDETFSYIEGMSGSKGKKLTLDQMQQAVATNRPDPIIEYVRLPTPRKTIKYMIVHEEGRIRNLPINPIATRIVRECYAPVATVEIHGDVILMPGRRQV